MYKLKTFIIRLSTSEISRKLSEDCFFQSINLGYDAEYFEGINSKDAEQHYVASKVIKPKKPIKKGRPGVIGCFFSHFYLWKKCIELNEPICILEHDGFLLKEFREEWIEKFDDICKLDNLDPYDKQYQQRILENTKENNFSVIPYVNSLAKASPTGNYFRGAYAYVIKPQGAKKLVDYVLQNETGHVAADQQIGDKILFLTCINPSIARLHEFYSIDDNIIKFSHTKNDQLL